MRSSGPIARLAGLTVFAILASAAPASANHSAPATYVGSAASGGSVEFDVSPDGSSVTRFAVTNVVTDCGTISSQTTGSIPIVNHAFDQSSGPLRFSGSFPVVQQAQGNLSVQTFFPSCTSAPVGWTASTTAAPPQAANQYPPGPEGRTAYSACVRKANRSFRRARTAARRARKAATTKQAKRKARRQLKATIRKRRKAVRRCATLR